MNLPFCLCEPLKYPFSYRCIKGIINKHERKKHGRDQSCRGEIEDGNEDGGDYFVCVRAESGRKHGYDVKQTAVSGRRDQEDRRPRSVRAARRFPLTSARPRGFLAALT
ncbi:hypothetical protein EVAR_21216_1 [Eumeta japonica]|uniref:Uncharacterized protein n=1 Tax=Eumeta variegata TaxID=151549 RepID=A0A4C1UNS5_EUMVA|nr:hypothetical protein EVAR_21216_1 [Eumeta japonica]